MLHDGLADDPRRWARRWCSAHPDRAFPRPQDTNGEAPLLPMHLPTRDPEVSDDTQRRLPTLDASDSARRRSVVIDVLCAVRRWPVAFAFARLDSCEQAVGLALTDFAGSSCTSLRRTRFTLVVEFGRAKDVGLGHFVALHHELQLSV
jgi:hypothetical protein